MNAVRAKRGGVRTNQRFLIQLAAFSPALRINTGARKLALQSTQQTFPLICLLIGATSQSLTTPRQLNPYLLRKATAVTPGNLSLNAQQLRYLESELEVTRSAIH